VPRLAPEVELAVYRIAQESLTNIARHASAEQVTIGVEHGPESVVFRVIDDGRGFRGVPVEHGGLRSMRERALLIDAALAIKPDDPATIQRLNYAQKQLVPPPTPPPPTPPPTPTPLPPYVGPFTPLNIGIGIGIVILVAIALIIFFVARGKRSEDEEPM
jgi:hypothetical protein